jgi:hypothetical protein
MNTRRRFDLRLTLLAELSQELQTDKIDLVILNDLVNQELRYAIVQEGVLLIEKEPYKVLVEPRILNEYFDFMHLLRKYKMTQA